MGCFFVVHVIWFRLNSVLNNLRGDAMFRKLETFFADLKVGLKVRWSDWRAGRIVTAEEAKANPERFVRQLIADTKNGYLWFPDPKDRFAYESCFGKHFLCRIFVTSKTFGFEISHTSYVFQLRDIMVKDAIVCHVQCSVMRYATGEQHNGNMKVRELFDLVADRHK